MQSAWLQPPWYYSSISTERDRLATDNPSELPLTQIEHWPGRSVEVAVGSSGKVGTLGVEVRISSSLVELVKYTTLC